MKPCQHAHRVPHPSCQQVICIGPPVIFGSITFLWGPLFEIYLLSGVIAQLIKHLLPAPRPKVFFQPEIYANFIEEITRGGWASFPSGHTATAFAVATVLTFHARNKWYGLLYLVLAILVGYSRIYLGQHFLEDVTGGAIIGACFGGWTWLLVKQVRFLNRTIEEEPVIAALAMQ